MFRSRSRIGAGLAAAGALAGLPATANAQVEELPAESEVRDLTFPVLDLDFEVASLDRSVRRVESSEAVRVTLSADVLFRFDRADLSPRARQRLAQAAEEIRAAQPSTVTVEGHTDSKGTDAYNLALSRRRAEAVRRALTAELGDAAPRLRAFGRGESEPVVSNTTPDGGDSPKGRARNRRVEIRIPNA
jgi:outer membrane protein OmpA-like peptidoglycan-associated protein